MYLVYHISTWRHKPEDNFSTSIGSKVQGVIPAT